MIRAALLAAIALCAAPAFSEPATAPDAGAPASSAPAAPPVVQAPAPAPATTTPAPTDLDQLKRELLDQARKEADQRVAQAKEEMRSEVRAELATQSANRSWDESWQEQKRKLDLLQLDGYLRVRPTLLHGMDLGRGPDPSGDFLFPRPTVGAGDTAGTPTTPPKWPARSQAWADMRFRLEPTVNVSEDIRIRAQFDILDDMVMGSNPEIDARYPTPFFSMTQLSPNNAIQVKRAWAEVNTPVGLLSFGRMGSNWGLGMFTNDGNCLDCDYGDTVDRISFAARIAGYYIVPMFDFSGAGTITRTRTDQGTTLGQPIDLNQSDDVSGPLAGPVFTLALAKRDTDKELQRKLDAGESSLNYGVYFSYRRQRYNGTSSGAYVNINSSMYTPDLWGRFETPRLRIEAEVAGVFGSIKNRATTAAGITDFDLGQSLSLAQVGAVLQGEYKAMANKKLHIMAEVGFASGDSAPGIGNTDTLGYQPTVPGDIDGPQFNCGNAGTANPNNATVGCTDSSINNFRFNRDYRVDQILWRELLGGVTDAIYFKPGVKYDIADGLDAHLSVIYSRTVFASSAPGENANLGLELDPGVEYRSEDGFVASLNYGLLIPFAGLRNVTLQPDAVKGAGLAHSVRGTLAVKF